MLLCMCPFIIKFWKIHLLHTKETQNVALKTTDPSKCFDKQIFLKEDMSENGC